MMTKPTKFKDEVFEYADFDRYMDELEAINKMLDMRRENQRVKNEQVKKEREIETTNNKNETKNNKLSTIEY